MTAPHYGFRFGRIGTAVVLATMPLTLPTFMLGAALVEAFEVCRDTFGTIPGAARYVLRGHP